MNSTDFTTIVYKKSLQNSRLLISIGSYPPLGVRGCFYSFVNFFIPFPDLCELRI